MTEAYGLPLFLAASSPDLTSSTFSDIYGRYSLWSSPFATPTSPTTQRNYVGIGAGTSKDFKPSILLDVEGAKEEKWTIAGGGKTVPVSRYLRRFGELDTSRSKYQARSFVASDGQPYEWRYRQADEKDPGWTCTTPQGYVVAHFVEESMPPPSATTTAPGLSMSPPRSKRSSFEFLGRRRRTSSASISSPETAPGGMLVVNESWTHIAEELLATLIILDRVHRPLR